MASHPLVFQKYVLQNGLTVYWQRRPAMPWMSACLCARAGHRYAAPDAHHVAHLLEHLLACGTHGHKYPRRDNTKFEEWTARQGFIVDNAHTDSELISVEGRAPDFETGKKFLRLIADMMLKPMLTSGLEKERAIILAERNAHLSARERAHAKRLDAALYGDHPAATYGLWPDDDQLQNLGWTQLREHHRRTFHPANMYLVVVSGQPFSHWRDLLEEFFEPADAGIFAPLPGPNPVSVVVPKLTIIRDTVKSRHDVDAYLEYHWTLPPAPSPLLKHAMKVLEVILTSRVREKLRATYDISVDAGYSRDYTEVTISTWVDKRHVRPARLAIERALTGNRVLAATVKPYLVTHRVLVQMPDYDVTAALEHAWDYVAQGCDPPPASAYLKDSKVLNPEDLVEFVREHLDLDHCVVGIYEQDQ